MFKIRVLSFLAILFAGSSAFLSDFVKEFKFISVENDAENWDFEYTLDNGKTFCGRAHKLKIPHFNIFLMIGDKDAVYWADIPLGELNVGESFSKPVRTVQKDDNKLIFKDDFTQYEISLFTGELKRESYRTSWNTERICFIKAGKETLTFHYVISSNNNSRKYNGTSEFESNDPHVQIVKLTDGIRFKGVCRVEFTDNELNFDETFCKGVTGVIEATYAEGALFTSQIDPNLLKSLTG